MKNFLQFLFLIFKFINWLQLIQNNSDFYLIPFFLFLPLTVHDSDNFEEEKNIRILFQNFVLQIFYKQWPVNVKHAKDVSKDIK